MHRRPDVDLGHLDVVHHRPDADLDHLDVDQRHLGVVGAEPNLRSGDDIRKAGHLVEAANVAVALADVTVAAVARKAEVGTPGDYYQ